jgi:hypothetical protein
LFAEPKKEFDPDRPFSYRTVWLGLIVSFIVWIALGIWFNISVGAWILYTVIMTILMMGSMRWVAATGGWYSAYYIMYMFGWPVVIGTFVVMAFGLFTAITPTNFASLFTFVHQGGMQGRTHFSAAIGGVFVLYAIFLAVKTRTKMRDTFIATVIALITSTIVSTISAIISVSSTLWTSETQIFWRVWSAGIVGELQAIYEMLEIGKAYYGTANVSAQVALYPSSAVIAIVIGFVIALAFIWIRSSRPSIPLSAIGLVMGAMWGFTAMTPYLLALVAKYLTLRVGGVELYNSKGKPIAIGLITALAVSLFLNIWFSTWGYYAQIPAK